MSQTIVLACASTLILLHAFLSFNVSKNRVKIRNNGESEAQKNELKKAIRAHGNASEYNAIYIALFLYFSLNSVSAITVVVCIVSTFCRVAHALGLLNVKTAGDRHPMRYFGALGTYVSLVVCAALVVVG